MDQMNVKQSASGRRYRVHLKETTMSRLLLTTAITSLLAAAAWGADTPAADAPKAKPYPFDTCIVTNEKLDAMGGAVTIVKDGQEVKFCCKGCVKSFNKDSAKYLKKITDAPAKGDAPPTAPAPTAGHGNH
jgi:hypothetical protein